MDDVLNDALSNLEHDNYGLDYQAYKDRQADIALIRAPDPNVCYGDGFYAGYWKGREEGWDAALVAQKEDDALEAAKRGELKEYFVHVPSWGYAGNFYGRNECEARSALLIRKGD